MTVQFLGMTDSDAIRAALGVVNESEYPDSLMTAFGMEEELELALSLWLPESVAYEDIITKGSTKSTASKQNRKRYLLLSNYAKFYSAYLAAIAATTWINKSVGDGQNEIVRFEATESLAEAMMNKAKGYQMELLSTFSSSQLAATSWFSSAAPSYDPVTGENS